VGFFELRTAESMLEKAKRELTRLEAADSMAEDSVDHVYNFFVTAYHICDYFPEPAREAVRKDPLIKLCGDACNTAKHMRLDPKYGREPVFTPKHYRFDHGAPVERSVKRCIRWDDGIEREAVAFAQSVIAKWEELFVKHGIGPRSHLAGT
jgi:hypothetical protein